jgi:hypothetical protein
MGQGQEGHGRGAGTMSYATCITIIDTIILTNYTNDAYYMT